MDSTADIKEKIIGENTLRDIYILNLALEASSAVVHIRTPNSLGTGFMVAPDLMMTNNHVINSQEVALESQYSFNYQLDINGKECPTQTIGALPGGAFYTSEELDFTVVTLKDVPDFGKPLIFKSKSMRRDDRVAISPSGKILASGSSDTTIKLWNLSNCKLLHDIKGNSLVVKHVVFSPDGQTLASCGNFEAEHGNIKLWDVNTGKLKANLGQGFSNFGIFSLAFCPDGNTIAVGRYGAVKLWDLRTNSECDIWIGHAIQVNSLVFSSCGQYLVLGCSNGDIKIWDWRRQNLLRTINQNSNIVDSITSFVLKVLWCMAISPEGKIIASCGKNLPLALWNFDSGTILHTFPSTTTIRCVAFSPDGSLLASGGEDRTVRIWSARTYELLYSFEHASSVNCLAFSPDARTLVSGGDDRKIQVWQYKVNKSQ